MAIGVGDGVGLGASEPLAVSVCAWTDDGGAATAKTKAIATATTSLRQIPVSFARESRDEQHMNAISKKSSAGSANNPKYHSLDSRFAPVPRKRQPVLVLKNGRLPHIVVAVPQAIRPMSPTTRFPELCQKLAKAQNSCCNIRHNRI
jgi:monoamine oxidase